MENHARKIGCNKILSYVDFDGKPLPFYYKNGYKRISSVKTYLKNNPEANMKDFEDVKDHVIYTNLNL